MRARLAYCLAYSRFAVLVLCGCAGDSSSVMSVWSDGGYVPAKGGQGGAVASQGGAVGSQGGVVGSQGGVVGSQGGQITTSPAGSGGSGGSGYILVPGGRRDLATAMCTATSGNTCPVPADIIECLQTDCKASLEACYFSDGVSSAAGGVCRSYANCMLACPCDSSRLKCEDSCRASYAMANPECSGCLFDLYVCSTQHGCPIPTSCPPSSGGSSGGASGSSAS